MLSCSSLCFSAFESIWQAKSATERFNWKDLPALSLQVCGHTKVPGPRSPCVADQTCYSAKPGAAWDAELVAQVDGHMFYDAA